MIADTLHGNVIDFSANRLGLYHQTAFDMHHKILMALQELPKTTDACLGNVSEFDETFALLLSLPGCVHGELHFRQSASRGKDNIQLAK